MPVNNMVEKWYFCKKCQWTPQSKDEQSTICPKCGNNCVQGEFIPKEDMQAFQDDLKKNTTRHFKKM